MNQAEVSGLSCVGLHQTDAGDESYATECLKRNQDSSYVTTKLDVVLSASTMHSDENDAGACFDEYQHTRMMAGFQPISEVGFGSMQHFDLQSQGIVPDSEEESLPSSPETSSPTNYDMSGSVEQHYQQTCNGFAEMPKMVDKDGPVMLTPEYVMCGTALHFEPRLTFSPDGFKIEYMDQDCCEDDDMIALYWNISDMICISCKWTQSVGSVLITLLLTSGAETGQVRVQFSLIDPQWPMKQQNIWHLASRYQEIWDAIPLDDFASENWIIEPSLFFPKQYFTNTEDFEDVIYPKGDRDAVSIGKRDVELLLPETFVNDTIIDFYIKHLSTRIELTEKHRYHFFNSFFFRKLADLDKDQGRAPEGRAAFLRVRKWTRKVNLFEKDFLFIPVNFNLHWSLLVICFPGEVETFEDGDTNIHAKTPCILHMDSLKGSHSGLKDIIQSYLWEEWKERHPESASDCSDKFLNLRFISLELPQQDNSFDCGLFLLHYVELFLMDAPRSFNPLKIDTFSSFLSDDWFPPSEASMKRSLIRKLIHELLREPTQDYPKLVCCNEQFDVRHQSIENAERKQAGELPAQICSGGEPDSVCTILGTNQPSASILNDSNENEAPASGCISETLHNLHELVVCPSSMETDLCLLSQDEKKELPLAKCNSQLDMRSDAPEDAEAFKRSAGVAEDNKCGNDKSFMDSLDNGQNISSKTEVEDKDTVICLLSQDEKNEPLLDCNSQLDMRSCPPEDAEVFNRPAGVAEDNKCSNEAEVGVHDTMDPKFCSISDNAELMASEKHSLERNTNEVEDENGRSSHDIADSTLMLDGMEPDPVSTVGEAEVGKCDFSENMFFEGSKDDTKPDPENTVGEAEVVKCDLSKDMDFDGSKDDTIPDPENNSNMIEVVDVKCEDAPVDHIMVEDAIKYNVKETSTTAGDTINGTELHVSSELKEGSTNNVTTSIIDSEIEERKNDNVMAGDSVNGTDETHPDGQDAHEVKDNTTCITDAELSDVESTCSVKNEIISDNTKSDAKRPLPDSTYKEDIVVSDDKCLQKDYVQGAEIKVERHYKRRKHMLAEKRRGR